MKEEADSIPGAKLMIFDGEKHGSYIIHSPKLAEILLEICEKE